jgi:hypothetical protein
MKQKVMQKNREYLLWKFFMSFELHCRLDFNVSLTPGILLWILFFCLTVLTLVNYLKFKIQSRDFSKRMEHLRYLVCWTVGSSGKTEHLERICYARYVPIYIWCRDLSYDDVSLDFCEPVIPHYSLL